MSFIMSPIAIQVLYIASELLQISVGMYCAYKLTDAHPYWIRIIVLLPMLASLLSVTALVRGQYIAYGPDVIDSIATALLYALVASRFTKRPWLDMRTKGGGAT